MILTVDVRDVEHGDAIYPQTVPIGSILLDCSDGLHWVFADDRGRILARRDAGSRVQVRRGEFVSGEEPPGVPTSPGAAHAGANANGGNLDDCPPHGITRRHGLYEVTR